MKQSEFWFFDKKEMLLLVIIFASLCLSFGWVNLSNYNSGKVYRLLGDTTVAVKISGNRLALKQEYRAGSVNKRIGERKLIQKLELNSADSVQLEALPMIGAKLAQRIIRYRDRLGGFYSVDQLKEVYGLRDSCFGVVKNRVWVDSLKIRNLSVNNASLEELGHHPYIGFKNAKIICRYRQEHGGIQSVAELIQIKGTLFEKSKMWTIYLVYP